MDGAMPVATAWSFAEALRLHSGELAPSVGRGGTVVADLPPHLSNAASGAPPERGGPNGGYLAALALGATRQALERPSAPRSLSVQFLSAPAFAPMNLTAEVLRAGRTAAFAAFRGVQGSRTRIAGMVSFGDAAAQASFRDDAMPDVAPPEVCSDAPLPNQFKPHFTQLIDYRWASDAPPFSHARPELRCWMRVKDHLLDAQAVCFLLDGIFPSFFMAAPAPSPNVSLDYRADFTGELDHLGATDDFALVVFRTRDWREGSQGWALDDAELWSRDGRLLAVARQQRKLLAMS